ncbi:MAG: menaquinone biosynthesis protein [Fimbriimonadales bacterium]
MSRKPFVVGSVPYLNAVPLTRWLETEEGHAYARVLYAPPSQLARLLEAREIDVALVSTAEHFRRPETVFVPGLGIASFGEVMSVRLFSRVPIQQIRTVALDTSSLTSSALVQILLRKVYQIEPTYHPMPPDLASMLSECDSALLIGDKGMLALHPTANLTLPSALSKGSELGDFPSPSPERRVEVESNPPLTEPLHLLDLGEAWTRWTGLPFVWAVWLANPDADLETLSILLHRAYAWGEANLDALIAQSAEQMRIPLSLCARYLREVMVYRLDERFLQGLERFRAEWTQHFSDA